MNTPNWQHHSRKEQKRKLKPQALRDARRRRQALLRTLGYTQAATPRTIRENHIKNRQAHVLAFLLRFIVS